MKAISLKTLLIIGSTLSLYYCYSFNLPDEYTVIRGFNGDRVLGNFTYGCTTINATDDDEHNCQCEQGSTFYWWHYTETANDLACWHDTNRGTYTIKYNNCVFRR